MSKHSRSGPSWHLRQCSYWTLPSSICFGSLHQRHSLCSMLLIQAVTSTPHTPFPHSSFTPQTLPCQAMTTQHLPACLVAVPMVATWSQTAPSPAYCAGGLGPASLYCSTHESHSHPRLIKGRPDKQDNNPTQLHVLCKTAGSADQRPQVLLLCWVSSAAAGSQQHNNSSSPHIALVLGNQHDMGGNEFSNTLSALPPLTTTATPR